MDENHFDSKPVYNVDEIGPLKTGKVIALKRTRCVGQIAAAERGTMKTMALKVSANGSSIAPFFFFPRKKMQSNFFYNVCNDTVRLKMNPAGCVSQNLCILYSISSEM